MSSITLNDFKAMFARATEDIAEKEKDLCALDGVCGDGDHGTAIKSAMTAANGVIQNATELKEAFFDAGFAALSHSNGSTSTLIGSLLMGVSEGLDPGTAELNGAALAKAFASGLASVRENTKADIGDKTLMDALIPAVQAMEGKDDPAAALVAAAQAAEEGKIGTTNMQAKFGRAKNLGERSIGSIDAGATSIALIFSAFSTTFHPTNKTQE